MNEFVRLLIDLIAPSIEQLLDKEFQERCLVFVLEKNRLLEGYGTPSWPEHRVETLVCTYFHELRSARKC